MTPPPRGPTKARPVYSSERGRIDRSSERGGADVPAGAEGRAGNAGDGVVRIRRELKGRRGKTVTTITGLPLDQEALRALAKQLKQRCGAGGSLKDGVIEMQGDHRDAVLAELSRRGYTAKLAGG